MKQEGEGSSHSERSRLAGVWEHIAWTVEGTWPRSDREAAES